MSATYCAIQWNDNYNKEINNFLKELSHEKDAFSAKLMQLRTMAEISRMSQQYTVAQWEEWGREAERTPDVDAHTEIQQPYCVGHCTLAETHKQRHEENHLRPQ